ncbi:MAG: UDP-N-acetylglucosamine 2-epimerase (non-hydrolyzing) [Acidobacteria bacterium]|nr:MAG: UDP-N-acetylglucosamine 2-epimerase (non-hydrolyzing) [Acidobacteriota bacterium]PYQ25933.1 MAG: UDP-N-acetylglucosamine 2-epimerase (non-hydrolyzing) [Acidobacteriota bacterium]
MKVLTLLGTRPELIRLSVIIGKLDGRCRHVLVHTGQNYDPGLSDVFFRDLGLRPPDHHLGARGSFGEQIGRILPEAERVLRAERPDRFLVLGDTNSGLAAIMAKRMGIPVLHMEAGNRCYDDRVPEEINRRMIDSCSDVLMPYTERSRQNLLREGFAGERVYVTGNPILEVIRRYQTRIDGSTALAQLGLEKGRYFLVTLHRAENVDVPERLRAFHHVLGRLPGELGAPVIVSTHPHTRDQMAALGLAAGSDTVRYAPPFGFFDFVTLERNALAVLTDSGTVQEECAIFGIPTVTLRDVTERPETIECGSNILSGAEPETVLRCLQTALALRGAWSPPREYLVENVSDTVVKIALSFIHR